MHQNSPFWDPQSKNFLGRGHCPPDPSPHPTPSAPTAPWFSRLRRSTSAPSAPWSMVPQCWIEIDAHAHGRRLLGQPTGTYNTREPQKTMFKLQSTPKGVKRVVFKSVVLVLKWNQVHDILASSSRNIMRLSVGYVTKTVSRLKPGHLPLISPNFTVRIEATCESWLIASDTWNVRQVAVCGAGCTVQCRSGRSSGVDGLCRRRPTLARTSASSRHDRSNSSLSPRGMWPCMWSWEGPPGGTRPWGASRRGGPCHHAVVDVLSPPTYTLKIGWSAAEILR